MLFFVSNSDVHFCQNLPVNDWKDADILTNGYQWLRQKTAEHSNSEYQHICTVTNAYQ